LEGILGHIDEAEAEVARLEEELADPGVYRDRSEDVPALWEALEAARARAQKLLDRWEELETKRERASLPPA
ncbi:MAG: ABC transporter C-terminal domain-containing protein, partial [Myxococcota bacterium]